MQDLNKWVSNEFTGEQKYYCFDKIFTAEEFTDFVHALEAKSGLKLMADSDVVHTLHGYVSMVKQNPPKCDWGGCDINGEHTSIIVSLYAKNKPSDSRIIEVNDPLLGKKSLEMGIKHVFKKVKVDRLLEDKLDQAHKEYKLKIKA